MNGWIIFSEATVKCSVINWSVVRRQALRGFGVCTINRYGGYINALVQVCFSISILDRNFIQIVYLMSGDIGLKFSVMTWVGRDNGIIKFYVNMVIHL